MPLTQVTTHGLHDNAVTKDKIGANQIEASELADNAVDTNAIADQAVSLSKLPHGDSNNNGKFLRANDGADPSFETVPSGGMNNLVEDTTPQLGGALDTNSKNIDFNDSTGASVNRARFGDNADLQIYHSPNSYIVNNTGDLEVQNGSRTIGFKSDTLSVKNGNDNETMATFTADGAVDLYHDNTVRVSTTSAGATVTGDFTATGNVTAYSDANLKKDISTINDALSLVGKLRGVRYTFKETGYKGMGVIAQEVEEVLPELVFEQTENKIKTVAYGNIVGVLINAINELKAEVDALKGG